MYAIKVFQIGRLTIIIKNSLLIVSKEILLKYFILI